MSGIVNIGDGDIAAKRDEALRRVGRNVVLFQQLEGVLKFLAAAQHPSMPLSAKITREVRAASIQTQTLGQVAGDVVRALYADTHQESTIQEQITQPWLSISFRIGANSGSIEENRTTLKALIDERNDLVHHLLSRWNLQDADSCHALSVELDEQRNRIVREIERYRAYANTIRELARELQAFIDSDAGKHEIDLAFLQQSRLATVLVATATDSIRADGWTVLSTAGHRLAQLVPDEFAQLKKLHGEGSLQKLVAAIELFELGSERTPGGGTRALYRRRNETLSAGTGRVC